MHATPSPATTETMRAAEQRQALLDSERQAHAQQPRNFKGAALTDKVVCVAPDGTGPTPTQSFDPTADQALHAGNKA